MKIHIAKESEPRYETDPVIGVWKAEGSEVVSLMGRSSRYLPLTSPKATDTTSLMSADQFGKVRACLSYFPVYVSTESSSQGLFFFNTDAGYLKVDVVSAANLEAVDLGGTSDPYCVLSLNGKKVEKTKILKKTLNPTFNESFTIPISSRSRSKLSIDVLDKNVMSKGRSEIFIDRCRSWGLGHPIIVVCAWRGRCQRF